MATEWRNLIRCPGIPVLMLAAALRVVDYMVDSLLDE